MRWPCPTEAPPGGPRSIRPTRHPPLSAQRSFTETTESQGQCETPAGDEQTSRVSSEPPVVRGAAHAFVVVVAPRARSHPSPCSWRVHRGAALRGPNASAARRRSIALRMRAALHARADADAGGSDTVAACGGSGAKASPSPPSCLPSNGKLFEM
jgi:hypothetical protein